MTDILKEQKLEEKIRNYIDPFFKCSLDDAGILQNISLEDKVCVEIKAGFPGNYFQQHLASSLSELLQQPVEVICQSHIVSHKVRSGLKPLTNIKNIIAVASGKGGVGKSTVAVNLALALSKQGAKVGVLDADIYGPSQPHMLGISGQAQVTADKKFKPKENYDLQSMSIGYLIDANQAVVWRGPMVSKGLQQILFDTQWQALDYLIMDLPPGTGDIQLTMAQKVPVTAAVVVTTPQEIALLDARKAIAMFNQVSVPILGVIENMSYYRCSGCDKKEYIFGQDGGEKIAEEFTIPLLGQVPLQSQIQQQSDGGKPPVVADPEGEVAHCFAKIACQLGVTLSGYGKDYSHKFPNISVEDN